jgi:hypothetical protein
MHITFHIIEVTWVTHLGSQCNARQGSNVQQVSNTVATCCQLAGCSFNAAELLQQLRDLTLQLHKLLRKTHATFRAGRSHMVPYLEVLQPLAERGHKVTVVTDKDASAWLAPNYPQFELQFVPEEVNELMHGLRSGNSSMAKEMLNPNKRGELQGSAV